MKIAFVSTHPMIGIQHEFLKDGNHLLMWWTDKTDKYTTDSTGLSKLFPKQFSIYNGKLEEMIKISDCVFMDYNTPKTLVNRVIKYCKKYSKPSVGANYEDITRLEFDRTLAKEFATSYLGLSSVESHTFKDAPSLIKFAKKSNHRLVVKAVNGGKADLSTYIPYTNEEIIRMAEKDSLNMFKTGGLSVEPFHENCYEICLGLYYNGDHILDPILLNQEYKGVYPGDLGNILTGEVGTIMQWQYKVSLPVRIQHIIEKMDAYLQSTHGNNFHGFIDLNIMVSPNRDIYLLEFTVRHGLPTEIQVVNMLTTNYTEFFKWQCGIESEPKFDTRNIYVQGTLFTYGIPYNLFSILDLNNLNSKVNGLEYLENPYRLLYGFFDELGNVRHNYGDRILNVYGKGKTLNAAQKEYVSEITKLSTWHGIYRTDYGYKWRDIHEVFPSKAL